MNAYHSSCAEGPSSIEFNFSNFVRENNSIFKPSRIVDQMTHDRIGFTNTYQGIRHNTAVTKCLEKGIWPFPIPFGFERKYLDGSVKRRFINGRLRYNILPNENSKFVIAAFHWRYYEKATLNDISKRLTKMGCKQDPRIDQILRNAFYAGILLYNNKQYKANFAPLISEEVFYGIQPVKRARSYNESCERNFPLNKFVRIKGNDSDVLVGYQRVKNDKIFFYYKNSRHDQKIKINKSEAHIHNLFQRFIISNPNKKDLRNKIRSMKTIHTTFHGFINLIIPHMTTELVLTKSQLAQMTQRKLSPTELTVLEERRKQAIYQIAAWNEFKSEEKFIQFASMILTKSDSWEILDYATQIEIQKILFPDGVTYDPDTDSIISSF